MTRFRVTLWAVILAFLAAGEAVADKLVVFHNGRTLRVKELRQDGEWSYLELGERSEIGVPENLIAAVIDIEGSDSDPLPNVQEAASSESSASPGGAAPPRPTRIVGGRRQRPDRDPGMVVQEDPAPEDEDAQARAARARSEALARAANRAARGRGEAPRPTGLQTLEEDLSPGTELSGSADNDGWPSLLESSRRQGEAQRRPAEESEEDDD
jgi:hypothetical protein